MPQFTFLLASQALYRVDNGSLESPYAKDDHGDEQEGAATGSKDPPAQRVAVGEVLKPFSAAPPGNGNGDKDRDADEF